MISYRASLVHKRTGKVVDSVFGYSLGELQSRYDSAKATWQKTYRLAGNFSALVEKTEDFNRVIDSRSVNF